MASTKVIGIDLGTTNSIVAVMEAGQPKIIANLRGARRTPSVVAFTDMGEMLLGQAARDQQAANPRNTIFSIKRFLGRRRNEVACEERNVPCEVIGDDDDLVKIRACGKEYAPEQILAFILRDLKKIAEAYLGEQVAGAFITVPAYFNDLQRKAIRSAGEIAGLTVIRFVPESTAAALAYGLDKKKNERICVIDLGGGTLDVSVMDVGDGVFEVLAINGDTHLGGDDFDQAVMNFLADEFEKQEGIDLRKDATALQRLKDASELAKIELSTAMETTVNLPFITGGQNGLKHLQISITRAKLEKLIEPLVERCRKPIIDALHDAKLKPEQIGQIIVADNQTAVTISVLQGEREFAKDDWLLGRFKLTDIPPFPRGVPKIDVTLAVDINGILTVSARDRASGKENKITVLSAADLAAEDIELKKREAADQPTAIQP